MHPLAKVINPLLNAANSTPGLARHTKRLGASAAVGMLISITACAPQHKTPTTHARMSGESVVLIGSQPARLAHPPDPSATIRVRDRYDEASTTLVYQAGRDYSFDPVNATLSRLPGSRIPDFKTNSLFGVEDFDHSKFPGFGNTGFFVFVDYPYRAIDPFPAQLPQKDQLPRSVARLKQGGTFRIVAYGDSITAGGDATKPELIFWKRWADALQARHPNAQITTVNGATGGDSTVQGLQRLKTRVLDQNPDLVLVGFGMNDHNRGGVPIPAFEENLREIIRQIRSNTAAEIVLFSAFPPNPKWRFGSHHMEDYAEATKKVATETRVAFADVFNNWQSLASRKKPEDLLGNNINHPNDFGHWIYFQVVDAMGL